MLSVDRSKKKKKEDLYRGHTRSHVCTNVHHITYVIIVSLCSATQYQISMKQNALIVLVYICICTYIYIIPPLKIHAGLFLPTAILQQRRNEPCLCFDFLHTNYCRIIIARISSDISIFYWREKKRERDKKRMLQWRMLNDEKI